jgi:AcrR family transcriptional regulator
MRDGSTGRAARDPDHEIRTRTERAVLQLSGELGYQEAGVRAVIERSGSSHFRFYRTWKGKADCYASAYATAAEGLCRRLLASCEAAPDWTAGIGVALGELESFVEDDRATAAGVIREVHVAGGAALARRDELAEKIAEAIDKARAETAHPPETPPTSTSIFVLTAIEATIIRCLNDGRPLQEVLGGAFYLAVASYLGAPAAERAMNDHPEWG